MVDRPREVVSVIGAALLMLNRTDDDDVCVMQVQAVCGGDVVEGRVDVEGGVCDLMEVLGV